MQSLHLTVLGMVANNDWCTEAFAPKWPTSGLWGRRTDFVLTTTRTSVAAVDNTAALNDFHTSREGVEDVEPTAVRAPLNFIGPYPCLSLRFPELATSSQLERNATGISLDFVLDTAANTNTVNGQVAKELGLDVVGAALPGVGAGGAISGGETFMLGNCELEGLPGEERFTFMSGLTASALPVASPAAAGLLGVYFFNAFPGGVEFSWDASDSKSPAVTFYSDPDKMNGALEGVQKIPVDQLPGSGLPTVNLNINGVEIPALLDTGSPITVINAKAAKLANVGTVEVERLGKETKNPFARFSQNLKTAQAAARGDILMIAGTSGKPVELLRSDVEADLKLGSVDICRGNVYVGDLPGLAALDGLGGSATPAAVLGMDILRLRPKIVYRPNEVFI